MRFRILSAYFGLMLAAFATACGGNDDNCDADLGVCLGTAKNGKPDLTGLDNAPPPPIPGDGDHDGWPACGTPGWPTGWSCDCNDADAAIAPDRPEQCTDGVDNDCDDKKDPLDDDEPMDWGFNGDGDAYGRFFTVEWTTDTANPLSTNEGAFHGCDARGLAAAFLEDLYGGLIEVDPLSLPLAQINYGPDGQPIVDCDDNNTFVFPGAAEVCDEVDNDCDGIVDDEPTDPADFYVDNDSDGFGVGGAFAACDMPDGYADNDQDCNDADASISPFAMETPGDGIDQDCDGLDLCYQDLDLDGFGAGEPMLASNCWAEGWSPNADDCNDADGAVHPNADENACDGTDNDCDGLLDDADDNLTGLTTFWADEDGDGFGSDASTEACALTEGWADNADDCNDADGAVHPNAIEVCDPMNVDEDCSGAADDADHDATGQTTWYADLDLDSFGSSAVARVSCERPSRSSSNAYDCNDFDGSVNPNAEEILYDNIDNDCDPQTEDDACRQSSLWLTYWPGVGVLPTDDVQVWVETLTADPNDIEIYEQWVDGSPAGTTVYTEADGVVTLQATTCVDGADSFLFRVIHNGTLHCANGSSLFVWMDGEELDAQYVVDPADGLCAQRAPLVP